jgi:uncharacterized membrane protein YbhN (UPF0104 family)
VAVRGLQLVATGLVTWFIFRAVGVQLADLGGLELADWRPRSQLIIAASLLLLLGYGASAALWGGLVSELGGPRIPLRKAVRTFLVANLGRYVPGKVWQIAGLAFLARGEGVSAPVATGAAVVGQAFALAGATLVGVVAFFRVGEESSFVGWVLLACVAGGVGAASVPAVSRRIMGLWFRALRSTPPADLQMRPGFAPKWVTLYAINWLVYVVSFRIFMLSFGLPGTFIETAPAFAAAYVAGYVMVFSPAGIGIREGVLTFLLAPVTGQGTAAALSLLARLWTTAVELLPAGALWLMHLRSEAGSQSKTSGS